MQAPNSSGTVEKNESVGIEKPSSLSSAGLGSLESIPAPNPFLDTQDCKRCQSSLNVKMREFSPKAWNALKYWHEVEPESLQYPICNDCYYELREILIDRADEIEFASSHEPPPVADFPPIKKVVSEPVAAPQTIGSRGVKKQNAIKKKDQNQGTASSTDSLDSEKHKIHAIAVKPKAGNSPGNNALAKPKKIQKKSENKQVKKSPEKPSPNKKPLAKLKSKKPTSKKKVAKKTPGKKKTAKAKISGKKVSKKSAKKTAVKKKAAKVVGRKKTSKKVANKVTAKKKKKTNKVSTTKKKKTAKKTASRKTTSKKSIGRKKAAKKKTTKKKASKKTSAKKNTAKKASKKSNRKTKKKR